MNKSMEEKRNKIIKYNTIIKGQEILKKEIENNLLYKKQFESIKKEIDKKLKNTIDLYINKFEKQFEEEIKIKNNELINSYINK